MSKQILYMPIGISGSGKSTYFKKNFLKDYPEVKNILEKNNLTIDDILICPDNIRLELYDDINAGNNGDWWRSKKAWNIAYDRINKSLKQNGIAILDAINTNNSTRNKIVKKFSNVKKIAIVFKPDVNVSNFRIRKQIENDEVRSDVPKEVLERQYNDFKKSVVNNLKYEGEWNDDCKNKIKKQLSKKFTKIDFINMNK